MEATERTLIKDLAVNNFELKKLYEEHKSLESKLSRFEHGGFLTTEEQMERKRLKKAKLQGVDQMMKIASKCSLMN